MKLTIKELADSFDQSAIQTLCLDRWLPPAASYTVAQIWDEAQKHYRYFVEARDPIVKSHGGVLDEENGWFKFPNIPARLAYEKELEPLMKKVITISGRRFNRKEFEPRKEEAGPFLSPNDISFLRWLIDDGITERIDPVESENISEEVDIEDKETLVVGE